MVSFSKVENPLENRCTVDGCAPRRCGGELCGEWCGDRLEVQIRVGGQACVVASPASGLRSSGLRCDRMNSIPNSGVSH